MAGHPAIIGQKATLPSGVSVTEGPYAEALEGLGGYYLIEAPDLDTLAEVLTRLPAYDLQIIPAVDPTAMEPTGQG